MKTSHDNDPHGAQDATKVNGAAAPAEPAPADPAPAPHEPAADQPAPAVETVSDAPADSAAAKHATPGLCTLAIDIGGTGVKLMLLDPHGQPVGERLRSETPHPATPDAILQVITEMVPKAPFERISTGFPGVVVDGVVHSAPNLDPSWQGYDLAAALTGLFGKPARVINDAGMQGQGIIEGHGVEMVITLGTGMGCAIFVDGRYVPNIELAHHPLRRRKTYEEYVGNVARKGVGNKRWNRRVLRAVQQILKTFNPRVLYLGGGNSRHLNVELPAAVRIADNIAGLLGGVALWKSP